jgi:peptide/nickel transport system substrate-binding protein
MKRKFGWLILSCLLVLSLVLASCAQPTGEAEVEEVGGGVVTGEVTAPEAEEEEEEEEEVVEEAVEMVTFTVNKVDGTAVTKTVEKPRYGGVIRYSNLRPTRGFDPIAASDWQSHQMYLTNEVLLYGDWLRAPAGTGEASYLTDAAAAAVFQRGVIAESWEFDAPNTLTYHIRKGVTYQNKPPANGRELVAEDIAFCINRYYWDPTSMGYTAGQKPTSVTTPDRYTLVVEVETGDAQTIHRSLCGSQPAHIYPPEVVDEFGSMREWQNVVGTGPFVITDYVPHSSITLERSDNYWMKHPLYGDEMPYLDGAKILIIPDMSTRVAALRTAKLDYVDEIPWEEKDSLVAARPEIKTAALIKYAVVYSLFMRTDIEPFSDKRVRHALNMALDRDAMVEDLFGGNAFYWGWSTVPIADHSLIHIPFDELPQSTQDIYTHNVEGAKQLLTDAGYPNGFKTKVHTTAPFVDWMEVMQAMFADVNVDLEIVVHEHGTWTSMRRTRPAAYDGMFFSWWWIGDTVTLSRVRDMASTTNLSNVDEPRYRQAYLDIGALWPDEDAQFALYKDISLDIIENAWAVNIPPVFEYSMWWPWLRDYNGEWSLGNTASPCTAFPYIWFDDEMQEEMGY